MGAKYKHLNAQERDILEKLRSEKIPVKTIAKILGYHISTIYREIKRNHHIYWLSDGWYGYRYYSGYHAQRKMEARRYKPRYKMESSEYLHNYVTTHLKQGWSPAQYQDG